VKAQVVVQERASLGSATQIYREKQIIILSNINQEINYASENYFLLIFETKTGVIGEEPPSTNIKFLERKPDLNREHQNLKSIIV
ncbi:16539_t:CDS:1, partial [Dentiscutata erythropus]